MPEISVNIADYLTQERIANICEDEIRKCVRSFYENESAVERLISNQAYNLIFREISDLIGEDVKKVLENKIAGMLSDASTIRFELFRRKDGWQHTESRIIPMMDEIIEKNRGLIEKRIQEVLTMYDFDEARDELYDAITTVVYKKMFGGGDD